MRFFLCSSALSLTVLLPSMAGAATEGDFLKTFIGSWNGDGMVLTKIGGTAVNVTCSFDMAAGETTLSMKGSCRALMVVRRSISADLRASDQGYSGTYTGPSGQPSELSGARHGNAINLGVTWARVINGDRIADMTIEKIGDNRVRLETIDKDLETGKSVITSRIDLTR